MIWVVIGLIILGIGLAIAGLVDPLRRSWRAWVRIGEAFAAMQINTDVPSDSAVERHSWREARAERRRIADQRRQLREGRLERARARWDSAEHGSAR